MSYLQKRCSACKAGQQSCKVMSDKNIHDGHRGRIDSKSRLTGLEFLEEHEQLEKLLFAVIPRGNTNDIAHALINEFGSIYGVITANKEQLTTIEGVGIRTAEFLTDLPALLGITERSMQYINKTPVLDTIDKMGEYAKTLFYGKLVENLYMISLNSSMRVIRFDKISEGTSTSASVSLHKIAKLAILNEAYAVVLTHNHPGGRIEPSISDLNLTRDVGEALSKLDVILAAHIIVACGDWRNIDDITLKPIR